MFCTRLVKLSDTQCWKWLEGCHRGFCSSAKAPWDTFSKSTCTILYSSDFHVWFKDLKKSRVGSRWLTFESLKPFEVGTIQLRQGAPKICPAARPAGGASSPGPGLVSGESQVHTPFLIFDFWFLLCAAYCIYQFMILKVCKLKIWHYMM